MPGTGMVPQTSIRPFVKQNPFFWVYQVYVNFAVPQPPLVSRSSGGFPYYLVVFVNNGNNLLRIVWNCIHA